MMTAKRKSALRKGKRLQLLARDYFVGQCCRVEVAPNVVYWVPDPKNPGKRIPLTAKHDYFGLWDLIVVYPEGRRRAFVQVTTMKHVSEKRSEILRRAKWPATEYDCIMGHVAGRRFRYLAGPRFETEDAAEVEAPKRLPGAKRGRRKRGTAPGLEPAEYNVKATVTPVPIGGTMLDVIVGQSTPVSRASEGTPHGR